MPRHQRVLRPTWLVAVLVAGAVASGWLLYLRDADGNQSSSVRAAQLRPLPPGPPSHVRSTALVQRETLGRMVRDADVVILARATAIGGSETVSPSTAEGAPATTIHRIRFSVSRVFRGDVGSLL